MCCPENLTRECFLDALYSKRFWDVGIELGPFWRANPDPQQPTKEQEQGCNQGMQYTFVSEVVDWELSRNHVDLIKVVDCGRAQHEEGSVDLGTIIVIVIVSLFLVCALVAGIYGLFLHHRSQKYINRLFIMSQTTQNAVFVINNTPPTQ